MIIGLQGQYDISVSLSGTRPCIYLAMRPDHGDFWSTPGERTFSGQTGMSQRCQQATSQAWPDMKEAAH